MSSGVVQKQVGQHHGAVAAREAPVGDFLPDGGIAVVGEQCP